MERSLFHNPCLAYLLVLPQVAVAVGEIAIAMLSAFAFVSLRFGCKQEVLGIIS
jgi:ABC-type glycerol-3-phosphate transport system permease component